MKRIVIALALVLCAAQTALADKVATPIPIGVAVAQTSNVALFGQEQVNGAKLAEERLNAAGGVNGTKIALVFQDTAGDEAGALRHISHSPASISGTQSSCPMVSQPKARYPSCTSGTRTNSTAKRKTA